MIERARSVAAAAMLAIVISVSHPPTVAHVETVAATTMKLAYVELADDPRYANRAIVSGIAFPDLGRPYPGSQVALQDAQAIGRVIKVDFLMEKWTGKSVDEGARARATRRRVAWPD
jgi:hypothetical protein